MIRQEFTNKTKAEAFLQANGRCLRCGFLLRKGNMRYNHRIPCELGGDNSIENCEPLCLGCDGEQTYNKDIPAIAKSRRIRIRQAGIIKPRSITRWRKFNGEPVIASRERT